MNKFIEKLKNGELKIETCPQVEVDSELTEEYIIKQLESYQKLLESEVIEKATNKLIIQDASYLKEESNARVEEGPVKKLLPNKKIKKV